MALQIGSYGFVRWEGPPPQLVSQHIQRFTKTGQAGISALALGVHGDPFQVTLDAAFANQGLGQIAENGYRFLIGASPQVVIFNSINYLAAYQHIYLVESVRTEEFKRHPRLIGRNYDYIHGWRLRTNWTLVPIVAT